MHDDRRRRRVRPLVQLAAVVGGTAALGFLATSPAPPQVPSTPTASGPVDVAPAPFPMNDHQRGARVVLGPGSEQFVISPGGADAPSYYSRPMHTTWIEVHGRLRMVPF